MQLTGNNYLNEPLDICSEFGKLQNNYFLPASIKSFNENSFEGTIAWKRYARKARMAFEQITTPFEDATAWEFPVAYSSVPELPFKIDFVNDRTLRLRISSRDSIPDSKESIMLMDNVKYLNNWSSTKTESGMSFSSKFASISIINEPFNIEIRDENGKLLTKTQNILDTKSLENCNPMPFSFVRSAENLKRHIAASFSLSYDEKIFGCGESFTRLNKRGQKVDLWTVDALGVQSRNMYKPIPFFMSSAGYGMFVHTSAPLTFDFGNTYDQANVIYTGDDCMDLFIFTGTPKEILSNYTLITGRSPMPPLWSFGLWMSRITYKSEEETRTVANKLRERKIPCDVIHLDTGWFEEDWKCDYKFSKSRFNNPEKMISDLNEMGFKISLWQLPYFTPQNKIYKEAIEKGYVVRSFDGSLATEDAVIDFSNEEATNWYKNLLGGLLKIGVAAIKADFGEGAPLHGKYSSGKSGFYEHSLYPLRYNKAVYDITKSITGDGIIWARSAWAGSQRYPIHWGGDAENTDSGMAASLRAGLSLGLCGFSFWSHDIGGFVRKSPEELYRRWMPFGMLTSHSRCHGEPPKEPWEYSEKFEEDFIKVVNLKYKLMPYIMEQAKISSENGYPMLRTLFFEYPQDPVSWLIEDQYFFGSELLVAPIFNENETSRKVYITEGVWVDYQNKKEYAGEKWYTIEAFDIPIILLVRKGAVIPHCKPVMHTGEIDWADIEKTEY